MIVMDEDDCMVSIAKYYLHFSEEESCGRCTPCRIGTRRISEILNMITDGRGKMEHIDELKRICYTMKDTALCALGQSAPNPVLSTMENFWDEYVAHVVDKRCPTGTCRKMTATRSIHPAALVAPSAHATAQPMPSAVFCVPHSPSTRASASSAVPALKNVTSVRSSSVKR